MRIASVILVISFSTLAAPPMPPAVSRDISIVKPHSDCTNCPTPVPYIKDGMLTLVDTPSPSPNLDTQILWGSTNINPFKWSIMVGVYAPTQAIFHVSVTNYPQEFFTPQVGDIYGLFSPLPH